MFSFKWSAIAKNHFRYHTLWRQVLYNCLPYNFTLVDKMFRYIMVMLVYNIKTKVNMLLNVLLPISFPMTPVSNKYILCCIILLTIYSCAIVIEFSNTLQKVHNVFNIFETKAQIISVVYTCYYFLNSQFQVFLSLI